MNEVVARTVKEVCRVYGIGKSTVYEKIADGTLKTKKSGVRTLVLEASVRAWFDALPDGTRVRTHVPKPDTGGRPRKAAEEMNGVSP